MIFKFKAHVPIISPDIEWKKLVYKHALLHKQAGQNSDSHWFGSILISLRDSCPSRRARPVTRSRDSPGLAIPLGFTQLFLSKLNLTNKSTHPDQRGVCFFKSHYWHHTRTAASEAVFPMAWPIFGRLSQRCKLAYSGWSNIRVVKTFTIFALRTSRSEKLELVEMKIKFESFYVR